jgi:hypothetical protein
VAVAWGASTPHGNTDVFVAMSRDGGATFEAPVQVNTESGEGRLGGELPPRVAIVRVDGGADPHVVVLWTARGSLTSIKLARSRDGGRTFEAPTVLQQPNAAGDRGWPALTIDRTGVAHAIWLDHRAMAAHGKPAAHVHAGDAKPSGPSADGVAMAQHSSLYHAAFNGSEAVQREHEVAKGVCYCCKTALATGTSGELLAAWRHVYPGNMRDMAFTTSKDGGQTFAPPTRVSEDRWSIEGCPDDGPAMAVDGSGTVHVVWPTVLEGPKPEGALFYASSTDDGRTFTPRQRVPTLGSLKPGHAQIVVARSGGVAIAWDEIMEGRRTSAMRLLTPGAAEPFGEVTVLGKDESAAYPVLAATADGLVAVWTARGVDDSSTIRVQSIRLRQRSSS